MIMFAERAEGQKAGGQQLIGGLDITVSRNYFGSQTSSFEAPLELESQSAEVPFDPSLAHGVFIRAPAILQCGEGVKPLAYVRVPRRDALVPGGEGGHGAKQSQEQVPRVCVAAANKTYLVTAFHPELSEGAGWHKVFVGMVERASGVQLLGVEARVDQGERALPVDFNAEVVTSGNKGVYDISRRVVTGSVAW